MQNRWSHHKTIAKLELALGLSCDYSEAGCGQALGEATTIIAIEAANVGLCWQGTLIPLQQSPCLASCKVNSPIILTGPCCYSILILKLLFAPFVIFVYGLFFISNFVIKAADIVLLFSLLHSMGQRKNWILLISVILMAWEFLK